MPLLRVFEHESLTLNDVFTPAHLAKLVHFHAQHKGKYYTLISRGVKFSQYVGVLQVGNLAIEILPKADKSTLSNTTFWRDVLLEMLIFAKFWHFDMIPHAMLSTHQKPILDIYINLYINILDKIVSHIGFLKAYQKVADNQTILRGQLHFPKHIQHNFIQQQRFFTKHDELNYTHPINQFLKAGLQKAKKHTQSPYLLNRLNSLEKAFEIVPSPSEPLTLVFLDDILKHNNFFTFYKEALELTRLFLTENAPAMAFGRNQVFSMLFDMNLLFEAYIYQQFKKIAIKEDFKIFRYQTQSFWQRRYLQPDILIEKNGVRYVLDVKWKILSPNLQPSMEDLRQLDVYTRYFKAQKGVLIYPKMQHESPSMVISPFEDEEKNRYAQIYFAPILTPEGILNKNISVDFL